MPPAVAKPRVLTDPGFLWAAPLGTADPTNTVAGSVFTDVVAAAYVPFGATAEGSTFSYSTSVEPIRVAEFLDPIKYATTERSGRMAFNLASWTAANLKRALNGGAGALTPTSGTGATALHTVEPPEPGSEVRIQLLWESTDSTVRILIRQALQGGEVSSAFTRAPGLAVIPCTFNFEIPEVGKPFTVWTAGDQRAA